MRFAPHTPFLRVRRAARCGRGSRWLGIAGFVLGNLWAVAAFAAGQMPTTTPPALSPHAFSWGGYLQALGAVFLLLAFLWIMLWLLRRYGKFNFLPRPGSLPRDALLMEAQLPLGPRKGLTVVRFMGKRLLLGVTEQNITLLSSEDTVSHENESKSFRQTLEDAAGAGPSGGHSAASCPCAGGAGDERPLAPADAFRRRI